jgi:hypothetical protein
MAERPFAPERRVSGVSDRRLVAGRGDRRIGDYQASRTSASIPCPACGIAWASLQSVGYGQGQSTATYVCPRCGHQERRVGAAQ